MNTYFEEFEKKLQLVEEKLDILSDWHKAKIMMELQKLQKVVGWTLVSYGFSFTNYLRHIKSKRQVMRISLIGMLRICLEN